jgi:chemosensory pili system protein ChpA (sensor histidine kinase/response regulator)
MNTSSHVKTIFFVEDSEVELMAYGRVLEHGGYCVLAAKDGLEALRLLHHVVPDLILLDLVLPKFDGVEVLKFIRSDPRLKTVPVIIFSTNSIIDIQDEPLLEAAAKRLIKGKCNPALLLEAICEVFEDESANAEHNRSPQMSKHVATAVPSA